MKLTHAAAAIVLVSLIASPALAETKVPEGTEFPMRLEDTLSSKSANGGDRFTISLTDDVKLPDGTIIRAGYRGVGEVVEARKNGMLGKTGKLNIRLTYIRIGDQRIRLRASRDAQGRHNTGAQVGTFLLLWPAAAFIKGKSTKITKGTILTAYSDQDVVLETPLAPPPPER